MPQRIVCLSIHLLLWSLCFQRGQAQPLVGNPAFRINHIGVSNGLTQGSVYYMLKDSRGFMWFGTQDGLNRYDGLRFRTYRPLSGKQGSIQDGSIQGNNIFGIVESPDGNVWIGTESGLNRYDRKRDRFDCFVSQTPTANQLASRILPFYVDQHQLLYLSDREGLVRYVYQKRQKTILNDSLHPTKEYDLQSSTVLTPAGDVWLHASTGLLRYNLQTHKLYRYFSNHPHNLFGPTRVVYSFYVDPSNTVWLGTDNGLIRFDYQQSTYEVFQTVGQQPISPIYSIAADQRGRLWLGTQHDGVLYFDKRAHLFGQVHDLINTTQRLNDFKISKIYVDDLGMVWANADPDGITRIVPDAFLFGGMLKRQVTNSLPPDQQLSSYTIRGFLEERYDRLWVLTENGINVVNPITNRVVDRYLTTLSSSAYRPLLKSLYRDPQRRIWVGISGGVLAFQPQTKVFEPVLFGSTSSNLIGSNYVRNLVSVSDTQLVAATEDGLYALHPLKRTWAKLPYLDGQNIFSISFNATTRQLWVGTQLNGYYCYQLSEPGGSWQFIRSGLKGYMILHIRPDATGQTVWLSSDRGLVALDAPTGRFRLYTERQGLANSFIYGSLADLQQNIWMSTNRGLARLEPSTQTIKNFSPGDGLQGYEFNGNAFLRAANGELYFGGVSGFNRFRPDGFRSSLFNPYVHIYSLNINEEPFRTDTYVGEATQITLNHTQNTLALEFSALDYLSNGHNNYQYQLTGYDNHWVLAGERNYVRYANLPPGDYVFQVKAANLDNHWSHRVRKLAIHIEPPFWKTLPFVILVLLVLLAGIWAWVKSRENMIRQQQADRLRLAYDIQEQVKKDIARDIHDEIGTRLATIKLYTTQLTQQAGDKPAILALKATIFQLINDTISDVRNLLRKLNPQTLEQQGYSAAVEELFSRINASGVIDAQCFCHETLDDTNRLPADTEVMLYRITQELVSNSLKHANARRIDLDLQQQSDRLFLTYKDNGQGFNYEQTQKKAGGLGIGNIETRVTILGGRITWHSQPGQGVMVMIELPLHQPPKRRFPEFHPKLPLSN